MGEGAKKILFSIHSFNPKPQFTLFRMLQLEVMSERKAQHGEGERLKGCG